MNQDNRPSLKRPDILFLSFFGVGYLPVAPGTWGSLFTLPFLYLMGKFNPPFIFFIPFIAMMAIISSFIAHRAQQELKLHDPSWIVIDEVLGMMTAWLFIQTHNLLHLILIFVFFRFFDIIKIWPASYFDKEVSHGYGTIVDDLISGFYAGLVYLGFFLLIKF